MTTIEYLNKDEFPDLAPSLFELLDTNMYSFGSMPFDQWYHAVSEGLRAPGRQILLVRVNGILAGFLQYYTNERILMLEELQIAPHYQGRVNFLGKLYGFLLNQISQDLVFVEAFVHPGNTRSLRLQQKLGMEILDTPDDGPWLHLRGDFKVFRQWYKSRRR